MMSIQQTTTAMDETNTAKEKGVGISYAITCIFSALLVVLKERNDAIHDEMVVITGHHWVTHGVLNLIIF